MGDAGIQAKELSAECRELLGVRESTKRIDSMDGTITYTTANDIVTVEVHGGNLPTNCVLIPEEHSYTTYKMQCTEPI